MSPREHRASLRRDLQEGSYCAQFKTYHDEMQENENEEPSVTEAELARVLELDAKATQIIKAGMPLAEIGEIIAASEERDRTFIDITPRLARELAAARAAIKAVLETNGGPIDGADTTDGKAYVMVEMSAFQALAQHPHP